MTPEMIVLEKLIDNNIIKYLKEINEKLDFLTKSVIENKKDILVSINHSSFIKNYIQEEIDREVNEDMFLNYDDMGNESDAYLCIEAILKNSNYDIFKNFAIINKCCEIYKNTKNVNVKVEILNVLACAVILNSESIGLIIDNLWDELYSVDKNNSILLDEIVDAIENWEDKRFIPMLKHIKNLSLVNDDIAKKRITTVDKIMKVLNNG